jgi:predicted CXXCH cytochrome family protein
MLKAKDNPDFRTQSVAICVSCHADQKLMTQYGLSTRILSTYVADFHGATAQLYPSRMGQAPEQAMCYDCHGNHAIQSTVSANGLLQANLLTVCQKCHKEATANFPAAWLGHHDPTPDNVPLVFWIRSIYNVLITGTVLLLVSHITLDIRRVFLNTLRGGGKSHE